MTRAELEAVLPRFRGEIEQVPPMYSAIKVGGQKLYEIARKGGEVARKPRSICIHELTVAGEADGDFLLNVRCSKGTYIRTLCHDIGAALGCGGVMSALRRTAVGAYRVEDAHTMAELQSLPRADAQALLLHGAGLLNDTTAIDQLDLTVEADNERLALERDGIVRRIGRQDDANRIHMAVGLAGRQGQGLLARTDDNRIRLELIVHERAEALAKRPRNARQGADGRKRLARLERGNRDFAHRTPLGKVGDAHAQFLSFAPKHLELLFSFCHDHGVIEIPFT